MPGMSQRGKKHQKSDGRACAGSQEGRKDQDKVPLVLVVGARHGAALVENVTQASEPSMRPVADSHWSSGALGQLQEQNTHRHESHRKE